MKTLWAVILLLGIASPAQAQYWLLASSKTPQHIVSSNNTQNELFQLKSHPRIYILDFKSPLAQANALNRIGIYVEMKDSPRDTLLTLAEAKDHLAKHHRTWEGFYAAHDYRAEDLARFFNLAESMQLALTTEEQDILRLLVHHRILERHNGVFRPVDSPKVLLSLTEEPHLPLVAVNKKRFWALRHELRHGYFFTSKRYRALVNRFWTRMPQHYQQAFTQYLEKIGYDTQNQDLLLNEFQAYLTESQVSHLKGVGLSPHVLQGLKYTLLKALNTSVNPQ